MKSNSSIISAADAKNSFVAGTENIQQAKSAPPTVSAKDKQGGKLTKKMEALIPKAIEHAPKFENNLPRNYESDRLANNLAVLHFNRAEIAVRDLEKKRLVDANVVIGIEISEDYRTVHQAGVKTLKTDISLSHIVAELGSPFKKKTMSAEKKAAKKLLKEDKIA